MSEEPKKISFGFAKINKKTVLSQQKKEDNNIQFIECLEENSIKLLNGDEKEKGLPVIPLRNGNILRDNMIEALKARRETRVTVEGEKNSVLKEENLKTPEETQALTLDELAAKEILEDLKRVKDSEETHETLTIPQAEAVKVSEKESTLEDYESMPVNQFGLAVLRGMGWAPDKGVGKNAQIVKPTNPVVRPKGMGLGADKVIPPPKTVSKEKLNMKKGASLKIISGLHKGLYGKIEGFDELPGRLMVRLTLQNNVISISENLVVLVTSDDYNKNSKILNLKEYNNFVDKKKPDSISMVEESTTENKKTTVSHRKIKEEYSSEEDRKPKKEHKIVDNYKSRHERLNNSDKKYKKHKYSRDVSSSSDSDREIRSKHNSRKHEGSKYRSSKYEKEKRIEIISSDSDSHKTKKKSKHKHSSRHKSRSRSGSVSKRKKKKKSRCRSRS